MYHVYENKARLTEQPISLNWLYNLFETVTLPLEVSQMKPGECVAVLDYKIVKVD